ncbi:MAG: hypothetical protein ACXWZS_05250 [Gemmatirosa sp.]
MSSPSGGVTLADATLADAADAPFVAHATWALARTPGMHVIDDAALVLADSGLACDTFNFVCRARLDGADAAARVRAAIAHFRDAGRPFSWWVGPADRPRGLGVLQASADGVGVYARIGFRPFGEVTEYKPAGTT